MKTLLIRLATWIFDRYDAWTPTPTPQVIEVYPPAWHDALLYLQDAKELVAEWERRSAPGTSGEYKRHQVFAALEKRLPLASRRNLSMAIEIAMTTLL